MIKFSNSDKTLTVISGLGNFPSNSSGGSDVTRQDVVNIVNSAITEYDAENQADLEEIREDVSGNTEDIAAHGCRFNLGTDKREYDSYRVVVRGYRGYRGYCQVRCFQRRNHIWTDKREYGSYRDPVRRCPDERVGNRRNWDQFSRFERAGGDFIVLDRKRPRNGPKCGKFG